MEFTASNVEVAVTQFYHTNSVFQAQAHQWLMAAQISPQAWSFVWDILDPRKAPEVQFFAASTLQMKVAKYWHEVPPDEYAALRKKLLEAIVLACTGHRVVMNRLCIALAACALHTLPNHWPDPVTDLMETLQQGNAPLVPLEQLQAVLLEILTVLPEEFQTMHIPQGHKGIVRNELQKSSSKVLQLVQETLGQEQCEQVVEQAVQCARAWMQLGVPLPETEPLADLLLSVAQKGRGTHLSETAVDALLQLATHPEAHKFPSTLLRLLGKWLGLHSMAQQLARQGDPEMQLSVYRLLIAVAENHSRLVLQALAPGSPGLDHSEGCAKSREHVHQLVQVVLECSATPGHFPVHETCSEMAFSFWYILQDDLMSTEPSTFKCLAQELGPVYCTLSDTLLAKTMFPEDLEAWTAEDQERFRCYRQDVADTMIYCYNVLEDSMLTLLHERMSGALQRCQASAEEWRPLEACLHAFFAVAEAVDAEENTHLPRFFACLHQLPGHSHIRVIATALDAVGAYAEWINLHPEVLNHVVPLLVMGLSNADVAPSATLALKDLTRDCQTSMRPFADLILQASQQALSSNSLRLNECVRLMYTVGKVLSVLPMESIMRHLEVLVMPYITELQSLQDQQPTPAIKASILLRLKMLSMLFATLDTKPMDEEVDVSEGSSEGIIPPPAPTGKRPGEPQPVLLVLQRVLPVLDNISLAWSSDAQVLEAVCLALKHAVSTLLDESRPLLTSILGLLVRSYKQNPQPPALDLAKQFLVMFGTEPAHIPLMQTLLCELSHVTLELCRANLAEHTDLAEAFFLVLAQVLKKARSLLLAPGLDIDMLFQCATLALGLQEGPTVKAAISFLSGFIAQSREMPPLQEVVHTYGQALDEKILRCIGGDSTRILCENLADILLVLNKKYFDNQCRWLHDLLGQENFPSPRATPEQRQQFAKMLLKECANKRKMQDTVREFSLTCRGLHGTEYGSQVSPYF